MVEVDTRSFRARDGDVYLLCSDGLTTMVGEEQIAAIAARARRDLRDAGEALIAAANAGRRARQHHRRAAAPRGGTARDGAGARGGGHDGRGPGRLGAPVSHSTERRAATPSLGATALSSAPAPWRTRRRSPRVAAPTASRPRRRLRIRHAGALAFTLVVLGLLGAGAYLALQSVYFIGTNNRGLVTMFEGLPYRLPGNLDLYSSSYVSGVERLDAQPRTTAHAARPLAALRRRRRRAGSQPRTGTARMRRAAVNRPILRLFGFVGAAVRAARRVHLALDGLRSLLAARKPAQQAHAARAGAHRTRGDPRRRTAPCSRAACAAREGIYQRTYPDG